MSSRYKVVPISQSRHCCFEYTVVDTTIPEMIGGKHYVDHKTKQPQFSPLCECFEEKDAVLICAALNSYEQTPEQP